MYRRMLSAEMASADSPVLQVRLALIASDCGDLSAALCMFAQLERGGSYSYRTYWRAQHARVLATAGAISRALDLLDASLVDSGCGNYERSKRLNWRGMFSGLAGDWKLANEYFVAAVAIGFPVASYHVNSAIASLRDGRPKEAHEAFMRAIRLKPEIGIRKPTCESNHQDTWIHRMDVLPDTDALGLLCELSGHASERE
jgi:tetratricopeptide (TPR) repeat protein